MEIHPFPLVDEVAMKAVLHVRRALVNSLDAVFHDFAVRTGGELDGAFNDGGILFRLRPVEVATTGVGGVCAVCGAAGPI